MKKEEIRKVVKTKLNNLSQQTIESNSTSIIKKLLTQQELKKAKNIGIYFSKENEVQTEKLIFNLIKLGKNISLPKIKNDELIFKKIFNKNDIELGSFNIFEPTNHCKTTNPLEIELMIMPCIAIDSSGNRIGRGKGFYDKYLKQNPNMKTICLAHEIQILKNIKFEKHDRRIDRIISEKRIIHTRKNIILNGTQLAKSLLRKTKKEIINKKISVKLAVILVGDNPASVTYVKKKEEKCLEVGIEFELFKYKQDVTQEELISKINYLNQDKTVTGILIQLPLPKHLDTEKIINKVTSEKDVDGLTKTSEQQLIKKQEHFACCAPKGIITLLEKNKVNLKNKKIVLIGYGKLVGKPLAIMLKNRNINFKVCNSKTKNLKKEILGADILISATGNAHLIKQDSVKVGAIVVDAGTSKLNGKIVGDVDFQNLTNSVSKITPVPGGVGPMTIAMLIQNLINAHKLQNKI